MLADTPLAARTTSTTELPAYPAHPSFDIIQPLLAQLDLSPAGRRRHDNFYALHIEGQPIVVLTHPDYAQHVFQHPRIYPKALHRGQAIANDDERLGQLRLLRPQFHRRRLAALCDLMVTTIAEELQRWGAPESPALDLMAAMGQITLAVLMRAMFGSGLASATYSELGQALLELVEHSPGNESAQLLRATAALRPALAVYDRVFDMALALCRQAEDEGDRQASLLAMLLDAEDERSGRSLSEAQLREEILFIFFVGFENIATALAHALQLLMAHPAALANLQTEVDEVLGDHLPTLESVNRLVYSGMVLQETLRLHPPVHWLNRRAVADDVINGHAVPAGALVVLGPKLF